MENQKAGEFIRAEAITAEVRMERQTIQKVRVTGTTIPIEAGEQQKYSAAGTDNKEETVYQEDQ